MLPAASMRAGGRKFFDRREAAKEKHAENFLKLGVF